MPENAMGTPADEGKKICFVVQGFGEKTDFTTGKKFNLDNSYQVIKEAVQGAGLECIRADEIVHSGIIDAPMYQEILHADLVIADLSTYNVNAAYELGVRHALRPFATIIVAEDGMKYPFDFGHIAIRKYKHLGDDIGAGEARRFTKELKDAIAVIIQAQQTDSPVYTYLTDLQAPNERKNKMTETAASIDASNVIISSLQDPESAEAQPQQSAKLLLEQATAAKDQNDFVLAASLLQVLRQMRPHDEYIVQQLALATYKSKQPDAKTALEQARALLVELGPESTNDPETLGLWGAVHKRLWDISRDRKDLDESIAGYERGFYLKQDYYNGINLAFLLNVRAQVGEAAGENAEAVADFVVARRVRGEVLRFCQESFDAGTKSGDEKYWVLATAWEAAVGLEDGTSADEWERRAKAVNPQGWMLESTASQLEKLKALLAASPLKHIQA